MPGLTKEQKAKKLAEAEKLQDDQNLREVTVPSISDVGTVYQDIVNDQSITIAQLKIAIRKKDQQIAYWKDKAGAE